MSVQPNAPSGTQQAPQPWGQALASVERLVAWMTANRGEILRHAWIPQLFAGLIFLGLGYFMGHAHFHLIRQGVRAPGRIVGYKQESSRSPSGSSWTGCMPLVQFHTNGRFVQFQDWLGSNSTGARNELVTVLYDPANPSLAMIDRPVWNWIPWAPTCAVGLLLFLSAINGFFKSQRPVAT
jgi:hypothetical protein